MQIVCLPKQFSKKSIAKAWRFQEFLKYLFGRPEWPGILGFTCYQKALKHFKMTKLKKA